MQIYGSKLNRWWCTGNFFQIYNYVPFSEHDEQRRMAEYHRYVGNNMPDDNIAVDIDDDEDESKSDAVFDRFQRRVRQNPQQILRYQRGGVPLWATINDGGARHQTVPDCELCGAPRQFELQLMPHLVALIDVDVAGAKSVDWATVAVFTCSASCTIPDYGYAREFAIKQDFE
jgi:pre-rRNA-processing protein TSR4